MVQLKESVMAGTASTSVSELLEGFRVMVPDAVQEIAGIRVHPVIAASNEYATAEQDLLNARARLDAAQKEVTAAETEVSSRLDAFTDCKAKLAELLK
jgi:hypothetical protein